MCGFLYANALNCNNEYLKAKAKAVVSDADKDENVINKLTVGFSPLARCYSENPMLNGESNGLQMNKYGNRCMAFVNFYNGVLQINAVNLNRDNYSDKVFAVLIDKQQGHILSKQFTKPDSSSNMDSVSLTVPYFPDVVEVHFYKQSPADADFVERKENFLCKLKTFVTRDMVHTKETTRLGTVSALDGEGNVISDATVIGAGFGFLNRFTTNLYSVYTSYPSYSIVEPYFGVIVLPEAIADKISEDEDRVWPVTGYYGFTKGEQLPKVAFNFMLPNGVDEFEFHIYKDSLEDKNFQWKYKIKLNSIR